MNTDCNLKVETDWPYMYVDLQRGWAHQQVKPTESMTKILFILN